MLGEQAWEGPGHDAPVLHDVADRGRHPRVVLQYPEAPVLVPDQVDPRDVHAHTVRRLDPVRRPVEPPATEHYRPRHHAVREHGALTVCIGKERFQRAYTLPNSTVDHVP